MHDQVGTGCQCLGDLLLECSQRDRALAADSNRLSRVAVGETVILMHPPLPLGGVLIGLKRGCPPNDTLADG